MSAIVQRQHDALRAFIGAAPRGVGIQECAAHLGRSTSTTNQLLAPLIAAGEVVRVIGPRDGRFTVICTPEVGAVINEEFKQAAAVRKAIEHRKRIARQNALRAAKRAAKRAGMPPRPPYDSARSKKRARELAILASLEAFEAPVVHRLVSANEAEPLLKRGPCSVFDLGVMA